MEVSTGLFSYIMPIINYLVILSIIGFIIMGYDKSAAKKQKRRIAERTLFLIAVVGGALGVYLGMQYFRHKTKHWYFKYGIPVLIVLQIFIIIYGLTLQRVIID